MLSSFVINQHTVFASSCRFNINTVLKVKCLLLIISCRFKLNSLTSEMLFFVPLNYKPIYI